jgi:uncharacterized RDD family membrane protein YckC
MILAGFWIRFIAHCVDFILWNALEYAAERAVLFPFHASAVVEQMVSIPMTLLFAWLYYVELPVRTGTTLGKRIFEIEVVDSVTGERMGRKQAAKRLLGYLASYLVIGCGFLMVLFHPHKLGLHDLIAGTASIRRRKVNSA